MATEVPFRLTDGSQPLILLPRHVNGKGPYDFILDTGASMCLLSLELAETAGVVGTGTKEGTGAGGAITLSLGMVESLAIGTVEVPNIEVGITDELAKLEAILRAKVDGNLGYNFLNRFQFTLDYSRQVFSLSESEPLAERAEGLERARTRFRIAHPNKPLILVSTFVNGQGPFQFALDTGASTTVVSTALAQDLGLAMTEFGAMMGAGGQVKASQAAVDTLAVGEARHENLAVVVSDFLAMLSQVIGETIEGVIGYNYLRNYLVTIDYPNEMLTLDKPIP